MHYSDLISANSSKIQFKLNTLETEDNLANRVMTTYKPSMPVGGASQMSAGVFSNEN